MLRRTLSIDSGFLRWFSHQILRAMDVVVVVGSRFVSDVIGRSKSRVDFGCVGVGGQALEAIRLDGFMGLVTNRCKGSWWWPFASFESSIRLLVSFYPSAFAFYPSACVLLAVCLCLSSVCLCPSIRLILSLIRLPVRFHPSACVFPSVCLCAYIRLSVRSNRTFLFKLSIRSSNPSIIPCTFPVLASTNRLLSARYLKLTHPPQTVHPISHGGRQVPGLGCYWHRHPMAGSYRARYVETARAATEIATERKLAKYTAILPAFSFVSLAFETMAWLSLIILATASH